MAKNDPLKPTVDTPVLRLKPYCEHWSLQNNKVFAPNSNQIRLRDTRSHYQLGWLFHQGFKVALATHFSNCRIRLVEVNELVPNYHAEDYSSDFRWQVE